MTIQRPEVEAYLYVNGAHRGVSLNLRGDMDLSVGTGRHDLVTAASADAYANAQVLAALQSLAAFASEHYRGALANRETDDSDIHARNWNLEQTGQARAYTAIEHEIRARMAQLTPPLPTPTQQETPCL